MTRIPNPCNPDRLELPGSPTVYLHGVIYATRPTAPAAPSAAFNKEQFTPSGSMTPPSVQDL